MLKILFVTYQDIYGNVNTGGIQVAKRNYDLVSKVAKQNIFVALICEKNYTKPNNDQVRCFARASNNLDALKSAFFFRKIYKLKEEKKLLAFIKEIDPDVLFLDGSMVGILLEKISDKIKKIVYFHNIETDYAWNKVKNEGIRFLPSFLASCYNEKIAVKRATKIISINERDGKRLYRLYKRKPDLYLPVSFYDRFSTNRVRKNLNKKELLFIGMQFPPNYQGIEWFVNEVMKYLPDYRLTIVGKNFEKKRRYLERGNVTVVGTVDDLEEYYYSYSAMVMPIQYGAGMKVKTAEAMMYGMTIFATDEALEGYQVDGVHGIYRCNTAEEFITTIRGVFGQKLLKEYEEEVRRVFKKNYETGYLEKRMQQFIGEII